MHRGEGPIPPPQNMPAVAELGPAWRHPHLQQKTVPQCRTQLHPTGPPERSGGLLGGPFPVLPTRADLDDRADRKEDPHPHLKLNPHIGQWGYPQDGGPFRLQGGPGHGGQLLATALVPEEGHDQLCRQPQRGQVHIRIHQIHLAGLEQTGSGPPLWQLQENRQFCLRVLLQGGRLRPRLVHRHKEGQSGRPSQYPLPAVRVGRPSLLRTQHPHEQGHQRLTAHPHLHHPKGLDGGSGLQQ